jgi:hypothetical protein
MTSARALGEEEFLKVSKFLYNIVFNICVAIIMSVMMSFVLALVNTWIPGVGAPKGFPLIWLKSFIVAVIVAIPVTFITIPFVRKILGFLEINN